MREAGHPAARAWLDAIHHPVTRRCYDLDIRQFLAYLSDQEWSLEGLTREQVKSYITHLTAGDFTYAQTTVYRKLTVVKKWLEWLGQRGTVDPSLASSMARAGYYQEGAIEEGSYPSREDVDALLASLAVGPEYTNAWLTAYVRLVVETGLRQSQLQALQDWQVLDDGSLELPTGNLPLSDDTWRAVLAYLEVKANRIGSSTDESVFLVGWHGRALTRHSISVNLHQRAKDAGLDPERFTTHALRRYHFIALGRGVGGLRRVLESLRRSKRSNEMAVARRYAAAG